MIARFWFLMVLSLSEIECGWSFPRLSWSCCAHCILTVCWRLLVMKPWTPCHAISILHYHIPAIFLCRLPTIRIKPLVQPLSPLSTLWTLMETAEAHLHPNHRSPGNQSFFERNPLTTAILSLMILPSTNLPGNYLSLSAPTFPPATHQACHVLIVANTRIWMCRHGCLLYWAIVRIYATA